MASNEELFLKYYNSKTEEDYEALFLNNIKLIQYVIIQTVKVCMNLTRKQLIDEFIDVGYIGLTNAIKTYNPNDNSNANFTTYAYICIRNAVTRELKKYPYAKNNIVSLEANFSDEDDRNLEDIVGAEDENIYLVENDNYIEYLKKIASIVVKSINNPKHVELVKDYFGLEGRKPMSYNKLAKKNNTSPQLVRITIMRIIKIMKKKASLIDNKDIDETFDISPEKIENAFQKIGNKRSIYMENLLIKYRKEDILSAIEKLDENDRECIKAYLGMDSYGNSTCKEICSKMNIDVVVFYRKIPSIFKKIDKLISSNGKTKKSIFEIYGNDAVNKAIERLNNEDQKFINLYFESNEKVTALLSYYDNCNISILHARKYKILNKIENIIKNENSNEDIYEDIINNYSINEIKKAMNKMQKTYKEFAINCLKFNNDEEKLSKYYNRDISDIYKIKKKVFVKLENIMQNKENYGNAIAIKRSYNKIVKYYGKANVDKAVSVLPQEDQQLLGKFIELDYKIKDISKFYNVSSNIIYSKIKKIFDKIEKNLDVKENIETYKNNTIISKIAILYGKDNMEKAISKLDKEDIMFIEELKKYNYKISEYIENSNNNSYLVYARLKKVSKLIEQIIICDINKQNIDLNSLIEKYGKDKVKDAINSLNKKSRKYLSVICDPKEDLRTISDKYETDMYSTIKEINKIYKMLIKILSDNRKK